MTLKFCSLFLFCSLLFILPACGSSMEAAGEAQETTADDPKTEEAAAAHEHVWEEYDCTYEVCTICGKFRHIN